MVVVWGLHKGDDVLEARVREWGDIQEQMDFPAYAHVDAKHPSMNHNMPHQPQYPGL